ncbi:hypothetical protein [Xylella fastidiosa]|nr:hypothetical protein [Xylella fastidiosa]
MHHTACFLTVHPIREFWVGEERLWSVDYIGESADQGADDDA